MITMNRNLSQERNKKKEKYFQNHEQAEEVEKVNGVMDNTVSDKDIPPNKEDIIWE